MHSFILKRQPKSFNSWKNASQTKKNRYKEEIQTCFRKFHPTHTTLTEELYGTLYYFFKEDKEIDADNLSKPLWDCLNSFLFVDDKQVRIRTAGIFNLKKYGLTELDTSGLTDEMFAELLEAFENNDHIVYVECGLLKNSMYKFNIEANAN